jgi:hypothetical protein
VRREKTTEINIAHEQHSRHMYMLQGASMPAHKFFLLARENALELRAQAAQAQRVRCVVHADASTVVVHPGPNQKKKKERKKKKETNYNQEFGPSFQHKHSIKKIDIAIVLHIRIVDYTEIIMI